MPDGVFVAQSPSNINWLILFPDRAWKTAFIGGDYQWLTANGTTRPTTRTGQSR